MSGDKLVGRSCNNTSSKHQVTDRHDTAEKIQKLYD